MQKKILVLALSMMSASALAEFKTIDFLNVGDGLITYDRVSGLYWLDLTYTSTGPNKDAQNSYLAIQQKTQTAGHPLFGFRHATLHEVKDFYTNAGLSIRDNKKYETPAFSARSYHDLTGVTYDNGINLKHQYGYTATVCSEVRSFNFKECPNLATYDDKNLIAAVLVNNDLESSYTTLAHKSRDVSKTTEPYTGHYLVTHYNPTKILVGDQ